MKELVGTSRLTISIQYQIEEKKNLYINFHYIMTIYNIFISIIDTKDVLSVEFILITHHKREIYEYLFKRARNERGFSHV